MRMTGCQLPQVPLDDVGRALSELSADFHGRPTPGCGFWGSPAPTEKTTTTYLIRHLLKKMNLKCGVIGTVEIDDGNSVQEATMTTPGAVELAELLASMRDNGCRACAMEVSSHALAQNRVNGIVFAGAAFTNLTGDHLDYHGTIRELCCRQGAAASIWSGKSGVAVVNVG